ncbi:hypothetical protein B0J14DRAFT_637082 [Halenospora varia]|nr:hypothetical protein B0J14DRAFT_637082 [Halenospora varia]
MDQITPATSNLDINSYTFDPNEIATLLSNYYSLLARMHYISPSSIHQPPHAPPINTTLARSLHCSPSVISVLEALPYVQGYGGEDDFMLGGSFADFRDDDELKRSRDPNYVGGDVWDRGVDEEGGKYVEDWVCVLNASGHRGSLLYFDTRNGEITIDDQGSCGDPYFQERGIRTRLGMNPHPKNQNRIYHLPSRPAVDVFADISKMIESLEWVPFGDGMRILFPPRREQENFNEEAPCEYDEVKMLYETYGWPENFKGDEFDEAMERYLEFCNMRREAIEPMMRVWEKCEVKGAEKWVNGHAGRRSEDGVWDRNPDMAKEEVENLEKQLVSGRGWLDRVRKEYDEVVKEAGGEQDMEVLMESAWRVYLKRQLDYLRESYRYYATEEGAKYRKDDEIVKLEHKMRILEERLENVDEEPMSVFEAVGMPVGDD